VSNNDVEPPLPLEEALVLLQEAEEARAAADAKLDQVMAALGFEKGCGKALRARPAASEQVRHVFCTIL
jgi:hypothetical protein